MVPIPQLGFYVDGMLYLHHCILPVPVVVLLLIDKIYVMY